VKTLVALAALAALSVPATALACPACARDTSPWAPFLVGSMLLLPFAVAAIVVRIVRHGETEFRP
jgi:hypothetical protein